MRWYLRIGTDDLVADVPDDIGPCIQVGVTADSINFKASSWNPIGSMNHPDLPPLWHKTERVPDGRDRWQVTLYSGPTKMESYLYRPLSDVETSAPRV